MKKALFYTVIKLKLTKKMYEIEQKMQNLHFQILRFGLSEAKIRCKKVCKAEF